MPGSWDHATNLLTKVCGSCLPGPGCSGYRTKSFGFKRFLPLHFRKLHQAVSIKLVLVTACCRAASISGGKQGVHTTFYFQIPVTVPKTAAPEASAHDQPGWTKRDAFFLWASPGFWSRRTLVIHSSDFCSLKSSCASFGSHERVALDFFLDMLRQNPENIFAGEICCPRLLRVRVENKKMCRLCHPVSLLVCLWAAYGTWSTRPVCKRRVLSRSNWASSRKVPKSSRNATSPLGL